MPNRPEPAVPAPPKLDDQFCFSVYALSRLVTKAYQPLLESLGLTYPQYLVLLVLWEQDALSVKALGEKLLLDSGTLTPLLKRMEQRGWLSRRRSAADERVVLVRLEDAGRALGPAAHCLPGQMGARLGLPPAELDALRQQLRRLVGALT